MIFLEDFNEEEDRTDKYLRENASTAEEYGAFFLEVEKRQTKDLSDDVPVFTKKIKDSVTATIQLIDCVTSAVTNKEFKEKMGYKDTNWILINGHYFTIPPRDNSKFKEEFLNSYACQLNALKEKAPEHYEEIIKFIDNILEKNKTKDYALMQQGTATNKLTKIKSREKDIKIDPVTGTGIMTWGDFTVAMKNFKEIAGFRTSTHKLLDALMIEFTETGGKDTKVTLSLKKLMELRGLKNEKSARRQTEEDLETLYNASISFTQQLKGKKDFLDMRLVIDKGIKSGIVQCTFHPDFYGLMKTYQVMPMNKKALALDDRYNPNAYYFLREFCEHMNMNYSKPNKNLISVMTLLKSTPEIPTYEELEKTNRQYKQKIIDPFERDLNKLEEIRAITWEYCHTNALPLSDEELKEMDYEIFHKLLIHFELIDYPQRDNSKKSLQVKNNQKKVLKKAQKNA